MLDNKTFRVLAVISIALLLIGFGWKAYEPSSNAAFWFYLIGWLSTLLVVGYYSTPTDSIYGKIMFAFVIMMVGGIAMKMLQVAGAKEAIILSLVGLAFAYGLKRVRERRAR